MKKRTADSAILSTPECQQFIVDPIKLSQLVREMVAVVPWRHDANALAIVADPADRETACRCRAGGSSRKERPVTKYFYRYQPPTPAKELLAEFWKLEKEAETLLEGLAK